MADSRFADAHNEKIHECIRVFEMVRLRPRMYLGSESPEAYILFQTGFQTACCVFGITVGMASPNYEDVLIAHGWNMDSNFETLPGQMRKSGLDDKTILNELIDIDIDILKTQLTDG